MQKTTIIWTFIVLLVLWLAICFYSIVRAENSSKIDYSWASRIIEEREVNKTIISEKTSELYNLEMELKKLKERNNIITCKLEKGDRDATCSL